MYNLIKVFDIAAMPAPIRAAYREVIIKSEYNNVGYWYTPYDQAHMLEEAEIFGDEETIVHSWLLENGADYNEKVIIAI